MKLRVTIDTDECDMDRLEPYVIEVDNEGVASMWYGSPSYIVPFKDVEIISCRHNCALFHTYKGGVFCIFFR